METQLPYGKIVRAKFTPKRTDNLRDHLPALIGVECDFRWVGRSNDDEPYPGQDRWEPQDVRFDYYWVPDEDLTKVEVACPST